MKQKTGTDICREYRAKYPEFPTLKLAKVIYRNNKLRFSNVESVRTVLRKIEGKIGEKSRSTMRDKTLFMEAHRPFNPYGLPESYEKKYEPFLIKGHSKVGILSDIHLPYHNMTALTTSIQYLKKQKVDAVLLNGDTIDCHHLSRFEKDPHARSFADEIKALNQLFDVLEKRLSCQIYFKIGNHELRYEHFLKQKAKELEGIEDFEFSNLIKANQRGVKIIQSNQYMKLNKLRGIHGHEFKGGISAPVNIARGLYLRGKVSAFQGHNHATSEHTEPNLDGDITTTWSIGCLCELHPDYMTLNKWNHGFAYVELDQNGRDYRFHNKRIQGGQVL